MKRNFVFRFVPKNPWHLVWIATIIAIILTAIANYIQSLLWFENISRNLLIIGTIDAVVVALIVAPIAIKIGLVEQQRINAELRALALTDELTGLNNRRGFFVLAEQLLKMAERSKSGMYLMYTDLDHFKQVNDTFGHQEGDRALQAYAKLLKDNYRKSDIIARIGGDEFVLVPVGTNLDTIDTIVDRFYKVLSGFNETSGYPWKLSATIGLAYYDPDSPCSIDELLRQADNFLYRQKGKNSNNRK